MPLSLHFDNQIVDVVTPNSARRQQNKRHDLPADAGRPSTNATSRFNLPGTYGKSVKAEHIEHLIPGDEVSSALPIPCTVDWTFNQVNISATKTWQRAGRVTVAFSEFFVNAVFVPGALVQFSSQLRGHEDSWYEIVSIVPDRPRFALQPGSIVCELRERPSPLLGKDDTE